MKRPYPAIFAFVILIIIIGYVPFAQFADYSCMSDRHIDDLFRTELWSFSLIMVFAKKFQRDQ